VPKREIVRVVSLQDVGRGDVARVGGKNASLGEMIQALSAIGLRVPPGFATTSDAYWEFVDHNGLRPVVAEALGEMQSGKSSLADVGLRIRSAFLRGTWPGESADAIRRAYAQLCRLAHAELADVAVRSSATAEDLPDASFAGQQESFLNVRGEAALLDACRRCFASLFTDRAISYRETKGFDHFKVALSIGVQRMVRSDLAGSGVMFSIDTETGFDRVALINAAWGLGENVVQGQVDPDEYMVFKPLLADPLTTPIVEKRCGGKERRLIYDSGGERATVNVPCTPEERAAFVLSDAEILSLARWACAIEAHYGMPMDMEWAKDGATGELFIVQARPETVRSRRRASTLKTYRVVRKGPRLAAGFSVGQAAVAGQVCVLKARATLAGSSMARFW
jgi:pyruvate,water dikinase